MTHSSDTPTFISYDHTLVLAIELSSKSWVVAAQVPGLPQSKTRKTIAPEKLALKAAIDGYRTRATAAGHRVDCVIATYEAGLSLYSPRSLIWNRSVMPWLRNPPTMRLGE